jgi:hypothetical protein
MARGTGFTILTESGQRTGPKLEIRSREERTARPKEATRTKLATGDRQYGTHRPKARNGCGNPHLGTGTAPETGRPLASTAATNRQLNQRNIGPRRASSYPSPTATGRCRASCGLATQT